MARRNQDKSFVVSDPKHLQELAKTGREAVMDAVGLMGPCRASDVARALGRTPHALYYHLKALRDCGLLIESRRVNAGGRETAYFDVPGRPVHVSFDLSNPSRRRAVRSLIRARLRDTLKSLDHACASGKPLVAGPRRELWATHIIGWLSPTELEKVNELFEQLIAELSRATVAQAAGRKAFELTFALTPSAPRSGSPAIQRKSQ